jgi:hypothetical protein
MVAPNEGAVCGTKEQVKGSQFILSEGMGFYQTLRLDDLQKTCALGFCEALNFAKEACGVNFPFGPMR